jgi:hypothetical protein
VIARLLIGGSQLEDLNLYQRIHAPCLPLLGEGFDFCRFRGQDNDRELVDLSELLYKNKIVTLVPVDQELLPTARFYLTL